MKTTQLTKIAIVALALVTTGSWIGQAQAQQFVIGTPRFQLQFGRPAPVIVHHQRSSYGRRHRYTNRLNNGYYGNHPFASNRYAGNPFANHASIRPTSHRRLNVAGAWRSRYGKVVLSQNGNRIQGTIFKRSGRRMSIRGRIVGRQIKFSWRSSAVSYGRGRLALTNRRNLTGSLTNARTGVTGSLNLVR